jgi:YfiR/HmsC-like
MAILIRARIVAGAASVAAWLIVCALPVFTQTPPLLRAPRPGTQALENEVKAVFLYNFAKYVDWPPARGTSASIRVCVPADPPFLALVREAVRDEIVNGRPLTALEVEGLDSARECDILYVGEAGTPDAAAWINAARGGQTLTVGEGRLVDGLVIAFVRDRDRLRFDISRAAAAKQNLSISSRLLGLARRVEP